jgi:hypothetical protein
MTEMFDYTVYEKQKNSFSADPWKTWPEVEKHDLQKVPCLKREQAIPFKSKKHMTNSTNNDVNLSKLKFQKKRKLIKFRINLYNRSIEISIYNNKSLVDLYIKIYNAVYPEYSTEKKLDIIPLPGETFIPKIHYVSVFDKKENILLIPIHNCITLEMYMKTKPEYFIPSRNFIFGEPVFQIYAFDEYSLSKIEELKSKNNNKTMNYEYYIKKIFSCIGKGQILKK